MIGLWAGLAAVAIAAAPGKDELPVVLVLELNAGGGVSPDTAHAVTAAVTQQVQRYGVFRVITATDVNTLIGVEREKQLLGCGESSCLQELGGALGAQYVLSGDLTQVGKALQLTMQTLDTTSTRTLGRTTRLLPDIETLYDDLGYAVAEATGVPPPKPKPTSPVPWLVAGGGAVALSAGGVLALNAFNSEAALDRELERGKENPTELRTLPSYRDDLSAIGRQKTIALVVSAVGAAAVTTGLGILLFQSKGAEPSLTVGMAPNGVVATGVLP